MSYLYTEKEFIIFELIFSCMHGFRLQREVRKKELEDALSKLNLVLRYDSRLCSCFINGLTSAEWTSSKVAVECAMMHWLYNFTDYEERCRVAATEESKKMCFHGARHFADYMKKRVYPIIKERIIEENKGGPDPWPWMENNVATAPPITVPHMTAPPMTAPPMTAPPIILNSAPATAPKPAPPPATTLST